MAGAEDGEEEGYLAVVAVVVVVVGKSG